VAYSLDRAALLSKQLEKLATQNAHQLAGQRGNLAFWLAEVSGVLGVLDEYPARFAQLRAGQDAWVNAHGPAIKLFCSQCNGPCELGPRKPKLPKRIPSQELDRARRELKDAAYRLLLRLHRCQLLSEHELAAACLQVGTSVDPTDLVA
jgi:hypothetical protein